MSESRKTRGRKGNGHRGKERSKGTGTLEKRGRVYIARWTVDGRRYSQSTGTSDRREAEAKLAEFVAPFQLKDKAERLEAFAGKLEGVEGRLKELEEAKPTLALDDAWESFLRSPNRPDTAGADRLRQGETRYRAFVEFMCERHPEVSEVRAVTKDHAQEYAMSHFEGVCNATRNQAIAHLRMMWRILIEDGVAKIPANVWDGIKKRREVHTRRRELTVEELGRVVTRLKGEMRVLFAVGIYTGLRLGDCSMLEWGQVDLVRGFISLIPRKTARKNGRSVTIPIHPVLMNILLETGDGERKGYVMPECAGLYQRQPKALSERVKRIFRSAGIETATTGQDGPRKRALVSFHSLRHTFVSMSANAGVPLAVVQSIVGHATAEMTRHYYHESQGALVAAVAALPDVVKPGTGISTTDTVTPRVKALCAALDALDAQEREMVLRHLQSAGRAVSVAPAPCAPESTPPVVQYPLVPVAAA